MISTLILLGMLIFLIMLSVSMVMHVFFMTPYVPSNNRTVRRALEIAKIAPNEHFFDLGCGDGRTLILAEKLYRARTTGFEIAPLVYLLAKIRTLIARSKTQIQFKNFLAAPFHEADVIFCYLIPSVMPVLCEKFKKECKKGTRIVSHTFRLPGMLPSRIITADPIRKTPTIYLYHI